MASQHKFPDIALDRLLRPLHSKIARLSKIANLHRSRHALAQYYTAGPIQYKVGTWNETLQGDIPPLFLLPPPTSRMSVKANKHAIGTSNLTKAIYDVRAGLEELLAKISSDHHSSRSSQRTMPLTSLCSTVIGKRLGIHQEDSVDEAFSDGDSVEDLDDEGLGGEGLYQAIPGPYRREAVLSHVIDIILNNCPPVPTLLMILLETTLKAKETYCASCLLKALFCAAVSTPSNSKVPKLCHKDHSTFLIDLYSKWQDDGMPAETFYRLLGEVIVESRSLAILRSSAVDHFVNLNSGFALDLFVDHLCSPLSTELNDVLSAASPSWDPPCIRGKKQADASASNALLLQQTHEWILVAAHRCISEYDSFETYATCFDRFFTLVQEMKLQHAPPQVIQGITYSIHSSLTCLALATSPYRDPTIFREFLQSYQVSTEACQPLVNWIIHGNSKRKKARLFDDPDRTIETIKLLASRLESRKEYELAVPFLSAALHAMEDIVIQLPLALYGSFRSHLVSRIEDCERKLAEARKEVPDSSGDWEYDKDLDTWFRISPVKHRVVKPLPKLKTGTSTTTTLRTAARPLSQAAISVPPLDTRSKPTTFTSLLSGAMSNKSSIHLKRKRSSRSMGPVSHTDVCASVSPERKRRRLSQVTTYAESEFESDDGDKSFYGDESEDGR